MSAATAQQKEQVSASAKELEEKITTKTNKLEKKLDQLKILLDFSKDTIFKKR